MKWMNNVWVKIYVILMVFYIAIILGNQVSKWVLCYDSKWNYENIKISEYNVENVTAQRDKI